MYSIPLPNSRFTDAYFCQYESQIMGIAFEFLSRRYSFVAGRDNGINLIIKYQGNPASDVGKFLTSLLNRDDLKTLLTGNLSEVIAKFGYLFADKNNQKGVSKSKYPGKKDKDEVEDLNEIAHRIFVEEGFNKILDKTALIREKNLKICPYCGNTHIGIHSKGSGTIIKPVLDHYLPKRKYPWLGMNYHNLVPCCKECNDSPNKHTASPISDDLSTTFLPHPYNFNDSDFSFGCFNRLPNNRKEDGCMDIRMEFHAHPELKRGYNDIIAIESLYHSMDADAYGIWQSMVRNSKNYRKFSSKMVDFEDKKDFLDALLSPLNILRFKLNNESAKTFQKYKFQKDVYLQFLHEIFLDNVLGDFSSSEVQALHSLQNRNLMNSTPGRG